MSEKYDMYILVGTITKAQNKYYNSARLILLGKTTDNYHKRALWDGIEIILL
jgi:predicted amidohydrolase